MGNVYKPKMSAGIQAFSFSYLKRLSRAVLFSTISEQIILFSSKHIEKRLCLCYNIICIIGCVAFTRSYAYNITPFMLQPPISAVFLLQDQPHPLHPLPVFSSGGDDINSRCIDTTMPQNIGKFGDVFLNPVKHPCEQVTQIVGKHLLRVYPCFLTQAFHIPPDIGAAHGLTGAGDENGSRLYFLLRNIAEQFLLQGFD